MKTGITIVALNETFKKNVARSLADLLDMNYIDVNEFVQYDVMNIDHIIKTAGFEYYNNLERKTAKVVSTYENTVLTAELSTVFSDYNYKFFKEHTLICFVKIDLVDLKKRLKNSGEYCETLQEKINEKVYYEREKIAEELSEITIYIGKNDENVADCIIKGIKNYYGAKNERN